MDCLPLDWKCIDGSFEKDDFYETIQAPKWIDFTAPVQPVDDHAWFCGRVGCTHERKFALQAIYQEKKTFTQARDEPALVGAAVAIPTARVGVSSSERPRRVVSSSLSSLTALRATYVKDKVAYLNQLPSIGECTGASAKRVRCPQASENENPNRTCRVEGVTFKKTALFRGAVSKEKKSKVSTASSCTPPGQVLLSQTGRMLEARTFVFGERTATHVKSTLAKTLRQDAATVLTSVSGAKILKARGTHMISHLQPIAKNSHLATSSVGPLCKSTTNARNLNGGVPVGAAACNLLRLTKDVKGAVKTYTSRKRIDCKEEGNPKQMQIPNKLLFFTSRTIESSGASIQERTQREHREEEPVGCLVPPVLREQNENSSAKESLLCNTKMSNFLQDGLSLGINSEIQTKEEEDSIQNTLQKFLENLRVTSDEEEAIPNVQNCTSKVRLACKDPATSLEERSKQNVVNESDPFDCTTLASHENDIVPLLHKEAVGPHDEDGALEQEMERSMRCSSCNEAGIPLNAFEITSLQMIDSNVVLDVSSDQRVSSKSHETNPMINQMHAKDWQRQRGTKRKSSELNRIKHGTRDHQCETRKVPLLSQQFFSTAKLHAKGCTSKDSWAKHHTRKTTIAPFRLRTEERGALKELGLARKEPTVPLPMNFLHCASQMPSFGHPFRPQRSPKKLTTPREPKLHIPRTRKAALLINACTNCD
ncbi:hypothetical protein L7F22_012428 [Adiantum nelumboides]|nr:hypothetical protein [Adiantum nelumboides]